jgi:hypothetical protein
MKTKVITTTRYTTDLGIDLSFKPANDDDVIITEKDGKLYVRYLVQDAEGCQDTPNNCSSPDLLLVNYHRDFDVRADDIITKDEVRNYCLANKSPDSNRKYWLYKLSMLSHSGVILSLGHSFASDGQGWDTSHVGLVLVSRKVWKNVREANAAAESFVKEWNQYLSGDIWGMCTDVFDQQTKQHIIEESEAVWGCYDYDYCLKELKKESEAK